MANVQILEKVLKEHRQSITKPRLAVFNALQHHRSLPMAELVKSCENIDRASVYRTVEIFEKFGIIMRIPDGWKYRLELGEAFHEHHHHAICSKCGASIALPEDSTLEKRLRELAARRNFVLTTHQIELTGLCDNCQG